MPHQGFYIIKNDNAYEVWFSDEWSAYFYESFNTTEDAQKFISEQ